MIRYNVVFFLLLKLLLPDIKTTAQVTKVQSTEAVEHMDHILAGPVA